VTTKPQGDIECSQASKRFALSDHCEGQLISGCVDSGHDCNTLLIVIVDGAPYGLAACRRPSPNFPSHGVSVGFIDVYDSAARHLGEEFLHPEDKLVLLLFAGRASPFEGGMTEREPVAHSKIAYKFPRPFKDWKAVGAIFCPRVF
jgi:hypothetical protein